jgi:adenylate kinase family enzyme
LREAISSCSASVALIDGFPRQINQALQFEEEVSPCNFTLYFDAPQDLLARRLAHRFESSRLLGKERADDNEISRAKVLALSV